MSAVFSNIATSASPAASPASPEDSSAASATVSPAASSAASAIAAPKRIHQQLWRADQLGNTTVAAHPSRFPELDSQLPGGGWPLGMLTELIARNPGVGELRLLIPMLRQLTLERKVVIMLAPPLIPYAPALASFGIDLNYLIIIQAPNAADRLWAVEQTLKSTSFGALLAWLPQDRTRPEHLRRMQLAAQSSRGPVFLFRELPAQFESSPAPLRLLLLPRPEQQLAVQLLKRRGPLLADPVLIRLPQPPLALKLRMGQPSRAEPVQRQPMQGIHARMEPTSVPS
jgi:protein ImuA